MSAEKLFLKRLQHFEDKARRQKRSFDMISNLRLLIVIIGVSAAAIAGYEMGCQAPEL